MVPYQLDLIWNRPLNDPFLIFKLAMKLFSSNCPHLLNLKAGYGYIFFRCLSNYLSVVRTRIKVRLVCKIPIVATPELTETISDQATMLSCAGGCVSGGDNVEYVRFNLPELSSIAGSTNSDDCYSPVMTKISNFLYGV